VLCENTNYLRNCQILGIIVINIYINSRGLPVGILFGKDKKTILNWLFVVDLFFG